MGNEKIQKKRTGRRTYQVEDKVPFWEALPLSFQHLFAMFGASVLVPYIFNNAAGRIVVDPALVLLMNGIGTLIYLFICKGKAPAFLGSSFAFLAPVIAVITASSDVGTNFQKALGGFMAAGLVFAITAIIIGRVGTKWLDVVLPPATMGPIVALIGLELAGTAAGSAGLLPADGKFDMYTLIVSMSTLAIVVFGSLLFRKFFAAIPILVAVVAGYVISVIINIYHPGMINTYMISAKEWVALPKFVLPIFDLNAILVILPAALVVISEHIGHLFVTGKIVERDLIKDPGLHRSMLGDGLSTIISGFAGSVPTTTYGENMGVMAITRVYSVWVIGGAAAISIILSFSGKLSGFIMSIPNAVMGGITLLLFGIIAASGIRMIVEAKVDYSKSKNLILTALVFIVGLSGVTIKIGVNSFKGMVLATIVGMILSLIFWILEKLRLTNDIVDEVEE